MKDFISVTLIVGARQAGQSLSQAADLLGFLLTRISRVHRQRTQTREKI